MTTTLGDELVKHGTAYMLEQQHTVSRKPDYSGNPADLYEEVAALTVGYLAWQLEDMTNRALASPIRTKAMAALVPPPPEEDVT